MTTTMHDAPEAHDHLSGKQSRSLLDGAILRRAAKDSLVKLDPRRMARNPVMMVVEVGSVLTTIVWLRDLGSSSSTQSLFAGLLVGVVLIVVGLTYFPVLALGPIVEHLSLR